MPSEIVRSTISKILKGRHEVIPVGKQPFGTVENCQTGIRNDFSINTKGKKLMCSYVIIYRVRVQILEFLVCNKRFLHWHSIINEGVWSEQQENTGGDKCGRWMMGCVLAFILMLNLH